MTVIPSWLILPYWAIILFAVINIITILLDSSTKKEYEIKQGNRTIKDIKSRDRLSTIPRIYFIIIYSTFFLYDIALDTRAFWGRWGIFAILFIDSYCHIANYVDYHWFTILKFLKQFVGKIRYGKK